MSNSENTKNGPVVAQLTTRSESRHPKTHQDFWKNRLIHRSYKNAKGKTVEIPEWHVRIAALGNRAWFNLNTANQAAAAVKARDIYLSLVSAGWDVTLAKFNPSPVAKSEVCTVGEFLADIGERSHLKAMTLRRYAVKLRKMEADITKLEEGLRRKEVRLKYDYVNGGRKEWLAKLDSKPMSCLTPDSVNEWRNTYIAKAGRDPVERKSAERSAASYLRNVRALFSTEVTSLLKVKLPANPFEGVKLKDPGPQRFHSDINPEWLLACAEAELRKTKPQLFIALVICLWAGIRRKEADLLTWKQVDLVKGQIQIRRTAYFEPKTEESQRNVDLCSSVVEILRKFKKGCTSEFVLDGSEPHLEATYDYYRCDCTWRELIAWLKGKGVKGKAIHFLRKESGSIIASSYGIEAARGHLGHRDIRTTSAHYVEKRKRIEVEIGTAKLSVVAS